MDDFNIDSIFTDEKPKAPVAQFYIHAVKDEHLSEEQGRPVYTDQIYLRADISKNQRVNRRANIVADGVVSNVEDDRKIFAPAWNRFITTEEYQQYTAHEDDDFSFTPLTEVNGIGPATKKMLGDLGIRSVEQLVEADDEELAGVRGALPAKQKAVQFVEASEEE